MAIISPIVGQGTTTATYQPAMMQYDGSTGYYTRSFTSSGNLITGVCRFNISSFTGGGNQCLMRVLGPSDRERMVLYANSNDHAVTEVRDTIQASTQNSSAALICRFYTPTGYLDGEDHVLFYAFDGDNGTAVFYIDGVNADDTGATYRTAPTTGTLDSGASSDIYVGAASSTPTSQLADFLGFVGYRDAYLTNYSDFMNGSTPKELDESGWTEWGAQPLFWNEHGDMVNNKGSAGAMTHSGLALSPQDLSGIVVADY